MESPEPHNNQRLIWALGGVFVVLLVAIAGLVGYIIADKGNDKPHQAAPAVEVVETVAAPTRATATPAETRMTDARIPDLRITAEKFASDGAASETTGSPTFKETMNKYGVPACAAILNGFADAFGTDEEESNGYTPVTIISVTQDGTSGTVVTREEGGEDETSHWLYDGTSWRFTCEGIFDEDTTLTAEPESTVTATTAADSGTTYPANPALGSFCPHADLNRTDTSNTGQLSTVT